MKRGVEMLALVLKPARGTPGHAPKRNVPMPESHRRPMTGTTGSGSGVLAGAVHSASKSGLPVVGYDQSIM
jgi:hypothetical protein